ncbi:MAG: AAA family ATPase, partial [Clostridia bacterium]|nr:AAA family ATPase [Clostridia bacterium]
MKILICGLPGTGKTKLANKIAKEHNFFYISDWDIFNANG